MYEFMQLVTLLIEKVLSGAGSAISIALSGFISLLMILFSAAVPIESDENVFLRAENNLCVETPEGSVLKSQSEDWFGFDFSEDTVVIIPESEIESFVSEFEATESCDLGAWVAVDDSNYEFEMDESIDIVELGFWVEGEFSKESGELEYRFRGL